MLCECHCIGEPLPSLLLPPLIIWTSFWLMAEWLSAASRCASDQSSFHDTPDGLETLQGGRCCKLLRHFASYALLCTSIQTVISKVPLKQFLLRVQHKVTKHHSEWGKSAKGHRFQLFVTKIHYTFKHWSHVCDSTLWKMCEFILSSKSAVHIFTTKRPQIGGLSLCVYVDTSNIISEYKQWGTAEFSYSKVKVHEAR